ncbi:Uncharacterised protein [uncultured archaeon]|nr:Uncharacterised protein [uncultured archaeon]
MELTALAGALTILYDVVTMLAFGLPFGIPLQALVVGQVPFTLAHLLGNTVLCFVFAPMLLKSLVGYLGSEQKQPDYFQAPAIKPAETQT